MKFEYDKEVDAAYIYLEYPPRPVKKTVELKEDIILDLDEKGKLLGLEILNASKIVNKKTLLEAQTA
ncbi:MAG: DUF2283 domain-containing protein [Candidatus Woesearchaeota archaeon]